MPGWTRSGYSNTDGSPPSSQIGGAGRIVDSEGPSGSWALASDGENQEASHEDATLWSEDGQK